MELGDVSAYLREGADARMRVDPKLVYAIGKRIGDCFLGGNKLILMGNGGSAADAQHIAAEFVGRFERERRPVPAIALHTNTSSLTAIGNDYGFDSVFERQVEAFARKGDVVIGISTSGNSENVLRAIKKAKDTGCVTVGFTGKSGGKLASMVDYALMVESSRTSIIQEVHIAVGHMISKIAEDML
ncbi:MAG: D-sedoheptulose 7-phosphate isomerase [Candidatus Marsarchaeota archaeon]|nr:D-sedoheptulose 7-phosphate isomerase [Candidatus Marsarchaeota archaeon]